MYLGKIKTSSNTQLAMVKPLIFGEVDQNQMYQINLSICTMKKVQRKENFITDLKTPVYKQSSENISDPMIIPRSRSFSKVTQRSK